MVNILEMIRKAKEEKTKNESDKKAVVNRYKCSYCGACVGVCPKDDGALDLVEGVYLEIDEKKCTGCGICVNICPVGALELIEIGGPVENENKEIVKENDS